MWLLWLQAVLSASVQGGAALRMKTPHLQDLPNETTFTTDVFMRSYRDDLQSFNSSALSITKSMMYSQDVIRDVLVVVPKSDVPLFKEALRGLWQDYDLPTTFRRRWRVLSSQTNVVGDGRQERMLDNLYADLYSDAQYFVYLDTDTLLLKDIVRDELFDSDGRPRICFRSVKSCVDCQIRMHGHVKLMVGNGEMLDHEFNCMGQAYPRFLYRHLRQVVDEHKGEAWRNFTMCATHNGASPWTEEHGLSFHEFGAMGAVLWRDFHDKVSWVDLDEGGLSSMSQLTQARGMEKRLVDCIRELMHTGSEGRFDRNERINHCSLLAAESFE